MHSIVLLAALTQFHIFGGSGLFGGGGCAGGQCGTATYAVPTYQYVAAQPVAYSAPVVTDVRVRVRHRIARGRLFGRGLFAGLCGASSGAESYGTACYSSGPATYSVGTACYSSAPVTYATPQATPPLPTKQTPPLPAKVTPQAATDPLPPTTPPPPLPTAGKP